MSNPSSQTRDYYGDTTARLDHDGDFRKATEYLVAVAREGGFTPGELRQLAFAAALLIEQRYGVPRPFFIDPSRKREFLREEE